MLKLKTLMYSVVLVVAVTLVIAGCTREDSAQPTTGPPASDNCTEGLDENIVAAFVELSDEDRTAALAQEVCPVTGEPLGSMGKPRKVTVEDQNVFLCCASCE